MNASRRSRLASALDLLGRAESIINRACEEERDSVQNMPENLERSDRYIAMEDAIDHLEDAMEDIHSAEGSINEAISAGR